MKNTKSCRPFRIVAYTKRVGQYFEGFSYYNSVFEIYQLVPTSGSGGGRGSLLIPLSNMQSKTLFGLRSKIESYNKRRKGIIITFHKQRTK